MNTEHVSCETDGALLIVTLNRPDKLNAYTGQMGAEITDAFQRADSDDDVRAVIVTGSGRAFCAGADVSGGAASFDTSGKHGAGVFASAKPGGGRFVEVQASAEGRTYTDRELQQLLALAAGGIRQLQEAQQELLHMNFTSRAR